MSQQESRIPDFATATELRGDAGRPAILDCQHPRPHAVRRYDRSKTLKVYLQCPDCGHGFGARSKTDYDLESLPWWDEEIIKRRNAMSMEYGIEAWERRRQDETDEWRRAYAEYRQSAHWRALKLARLKVDNFQCQNCGSEVEAHTSQAHHILPWGYETYNRYGYSMRFEVVTLCTQCHQRAHGEAPE